VPGTRTLVVIERESSGPTCYGYATRTPAEHGQPYLDAVKCYSLSDPLDQKGPKGYPYRLVAKLYDVNDLVAVKQGSKKPWDIRQYATLDLPGSNPGEYVTSGAYNPVRGEFYLLRYTGGGVNTVYVYSGFGSERRGAAGVDDRCTPPVVRRRPRCAAMTSTTISTASSTKAARYADGGSVRRSPRQRPGRPRGRRLRAAARGSVRRHHRQRRRRRGQRRLRDAGRAARRAGAACRAAVQRSTVSFRWSRPLTGGAVTDYVLEAGVAPGTTFYAASVGLTTAVSVPNVGNGRHYVRVRARNANGTGAASKEVTVSVGCSSGPRRVVVAAGDDVGRSRQSSRGPIRTAAAARATKWR
jgi:hypothetical protein